MTSRFVRGGAAAFSAACLIAMSASAPAEEGMWTFDNFPSAQARRAIGFAPDQAWLDRVRLGSVRLEGGCSAAFVSPEGLLQTNAHCVSACVQALSRPGDDVAASGVTARARDDEMPCPDMVANVVTAISDVTARIEAATANVGAADFAQARDAEFSRLVSACRGEAADRRCQVVTLYRGGQYSLYTYQRFDDLRLVFVPEHATALFGGDPDNFNFPRYNLDIAYLRAYVNDRPARTPAFLRWRTTPLTEGEPVFVAGNPGATSRHLTLAQLAFQRDYYLPWRLAYLSELRGRLIQFSERGPAEARMTADLLLSVENSFKAFTGRRAALVSAEGFGAVERREADLRARTARDAASARAVAGAWDEVAAATQAYRGFYLAHELAEVRLGGGSELLFIARDLVRGAAERARPDAERIAMFTDARLASIEARLFADARFEPALEELQISFWLSKTRESLTANDPLVQRMLGRESPEELARRLVTQTQLGDRGVRRALWEGGAAAIAQSNDPMIIFLREWERDARALRTRYQQEVEGPIARAQERIAQARFQAYGTGLYPDATFTLRLSYGRVAGWTEPGGRVIAPFTRFAGLYERASGAAPFALPESWLSARRRVRPDVIFNVASSNDIIGGNSGSPLLDREGRVVGAAFDGNIHSLGGEYYFNDTLDRTVSVAVTGIHEALTNVYRMDGLVRELQQP